MAAHQLQSSFATQSLQTVSVKVFVSSALHDVSSFTQAFACHIRPVTLSDTTQFHVVEVHVHEIQLNLVCGVTLVHTLWAES